MNPELNLLQAYPFEKLNSLKASAKSPSTTTPPIAFSIGEPKHAPPAFVLDKLKNSLDQISSYPSTKGLAVLREAIAQWLNERFKLQTCPINLETQVLPVNGTREALFAFAQAVIDRTKNPLIISPNPFYQIYEGAAHLAGAELFFMNCTAENRYLPDFSQVPEKVWQRCQLIYICSPGNPSGAVMPKKQLMSLIELADKYDFVIASDECYSEIYFNEAEPPTGLLQVCAEMGRTNFERCVVFHSLSKRSNLPGLRSGFVAGDARILQQFLLYRTYHGCAMSAPSQLASAVAWQDEEHVIENRKLYRQKFTNVLDILAPVSDITLPEAGFYLWLPTPIDDQRFTQQLYSHEHLTVLPGSFIARKAHDANPGENHVRMALVATVDECTEGAIRLRNFLNTF